MEVRLEVPDFVWGVGDKVSVKNEHNKHSINVVIIGGKVRGSWEFDLIKGTAVWINTMGVISSDNQEACLDASYTTTILPDSYTDSTPPKRLTPNTCITWSKWELEAKGEKQEE